MDKNLQADLINEIIRILDPIRFASDSPEACQLLFSRLGWNIENLAGLDMPKLLGAFNTIYEGISAIADDPLEELADVIRSFEALAAVIDGFQTIAVVAQSINGKRLPPEFADIGTDLIEYLIIDYLWQYHSSLYYAGVFLTIISDPSESDPATRPPMLIVDDVVVRFSEPRPRFNLNNLRSLLKDYPAYLRSEYWPNNLTTAADADHAANLLFRRMMWFLTSIPTVRAMYGVPSELMAKYSWDWGTYGNQVIPHMLTVLCQVPTFSIDEGSGTITATGDVSFGATFSLSSQDRENLGLVVSPFGDLAIDSAILGWQLLFKLAASTDGFAIGPDGFQVLIDDSNNAEVKGSFGLRKLSSADGVPNFLIGSVKSTRFQINEISFTSQINLDQSNQEYGFLLDLHQVLLVISAGDGDGFLKKVLPPGGIRAEFDLALGWSNRKGFYFQGAAGLEAELLLDIDLFGIIRVNSVFISLRAKADNGPPSIVAAMAVTTTLKLGPFTAIAERFGLTSDLAFPPTGGNLGPAQLALGFKPPSGIGLSLTSGPVRGGGYLSINPEAGEYIGVVQLEFLAISLKAIGILTTKLPDGSEGFSLLILISAEFTPIQLGFGFTLIGVGGLIGINRDMLLDPLRTGIKNHTLDSILFPQDPVANVTQIIGNLKAVFPPVQGRFTFGLMAKLGWGTPSVLTAELGIIIVLLEPVRLAILGKIQLALPQNNEDAIVRLRLDVLGTIDFSKSELAIDAILYDSRIAIFDISGGMALRVSWGANPAFAIAIGGFNPRFPVPAGFPILDRLSLSLSSSDGNFSMSLASYLALTANTVQIGANLDIFVRKEFLGTWTVNAYLGFDALIYFSPFHFIVDIFGGAVLKHNGNPFLSLELYLSVSGPGYWVVNGKVTFDFWGRHEVAVALTFGDPSPTPPLPPVNLLEELKHAIEDPRSWSAQLPDAGQMFVALRTIEAPTLILVHPLSLLTVRERLVPLETTITHFGGSDPGPTRYLKIDSIQIGQQSVPIDAATPIREKFAPGQFFERTEDQKLAGPEFEALPAGLAGIGSIATKWGKEVESTFEYETIVIDAIQESPIKSEEKYQPTQEVVLTLAHVGAAGVAPSRRDGAGEFQGPKKGIEVHEPAYRITTKRRNARMQDTRYASFTEATAVLSTINQSADRQVVGSHEGISK
jgi:hypothetical protein